MSYGGTNEAWIVGAIRTPIGRHGGALAAVRPGRPMSTLAGVSSR